MAEIRHRYEVFDDDHSQIHERTKQFRSDQSSKIAALFPYRPPVLMGLSPLEEAATALRVEVERVHGFAGAISKQLDVDLAASEVAMAQSVSKGEMRFAEFAKEYEAAVAQLQPEQRKLLESHQQVLEQTRELPNLIGQRDKAKKDVEERLRQLIALCGEIIALLEQRSETRKQAVARFSADLEKAGMKSELKRLQLGDSYQELFAKYRAGFEAVGALQQHAQAEHTLHARLKRFYRNLVGLVG